MNQRFEDQIDDALRQKPAVCVPEHFRERLLEDLRQTPVRRADRRWMFSAAAFASLATVASAIAVFNPAAAFIVLGIETLLSIAWLGHAAFGASDS